MMKAVGTVLLEFDPERNRTDRGTGVRDSLSVVVQTGRNLWVASKETATLERLTTEDWRVFRHHATFALSEFIDLPGGEGAEVDIEGLAAEGGYLWLVGSHSSKRRAPKRTGDAREEMEGLARVEREGNRFTFARIPLAETEASSGDYELRKYVTLFGGAQTSLAAAQLQGDAQGDALTGALREDEHLAPFLDIPGTDNGFDIEGLAIVGGRFFVGLRGPVLSGWACVLEIEVEAAADAPELLRLRKIGEGGRLYRKHFLDLEGLGVRELCAHGSDLLVLAGPTMELDGPVSVFRWKDAAGARRENLVRSPQLEKLFDVPYGVGDEGGRDHPEGITLFSQNAERPALLVVYDAPTEARRRRNVGVLADVFELEG